MGQTFLMLA